MDQAITITILQKVFTLILEVSAPILIISAVVGLIISIFQTITQIQESTITFVPKIIAGIVALIILLPWIINLFISRTNELFNLIPSLIMG